MQGRGCYDIELNGGIRCEVLTLKTVQQVGVHSNAFRSYR